MNEATKITWLQYYQSKINMTEIDIVYLKNIGKGLTIMKMFLY